MTQDTKLQQLVINKLTTAQYNAAVEAGTIDPNQLYMTTDAVTVDDVKVNGTSVVTNNTANITLGTMATENKSNYSTKAVADTLYADKSLETTVSTHISASNPHNITKTTVGLGNVDNTSDANKPVSTAQQTALNGKVDKTNTANKIYGTDSSGVQTTYDVTSFGLVDDVKVGTTSVVSNKIATLGTMAGENTSSYYTKTEVDGMVSAGMHYKGTVASYNNLPTSGQVIGDLWNVTDTGANYAWNGTTWDKMSETIDLSGYVPTSRTINGKALTTNITLSASDVNALPSSTIIPTVNNATLTIQKNGTNVQTFTANASSDVTANITVPTTVAELIDASDYVKKDGGSAEQTIRLTSGSGTTALGVKSMSASSYISFSGASKWLGSYGVTTNKEPTFYNGTSHLLAYEEDIPTTVAELTDSSNYLTTSDVVNVSTVTLATVATTGSYNDLSNKPTIPTVNNATLTIQKNGTTVNTFTANSASNVTANITVPTTVSELTDASNYALVSSLATVATSGDYDDLTNKPTIPTVNNSTITIQKNGTTVDSFTTNASSGKTINITVPTTASDVSAVAANSAITGATKCKITYDSKGLVTAGANLSASDIPDLSATYQTKLTSGTNIKTINSTSLLGSGNISITGLPSQTSQSGKFLTTNGTTASWATVDALPSQSGNSGKFLTTNGTTASWETVTQPSIATTSVAGLVKPDGTTITITNDGTISAASGAYAMVIVDYTAEEE